MRYIIFIGLAIIEQIIMMIITREIIQLQYEYVSINYATFKFADKDEKFCGLNILLKLFFPIIYIIILSGVFYELEHEKLINNIYMITIFYYIIRWINITFILNRKELHDWKLEFIICIIGIILNVIIYNIFIRKTNQIFISINELRDGIWIGIITFFFVLIRDYIYKYAHTDAATTERRKINYILKKYYYYKKKYNHIINEDNKDIETMVYGIMIYENYNRPAFYRFFEYIKCIIAGQATLGVMQVKSNKIISNEESVEKGYNYIKKLYKKIVNGSKDNEFEENKQMKKIISKYNAGQKYTDEILYIMEVIKNEIIYN